MILPKELQTKEQKELASKSKGLYEVVLEVYQDSANKQQRTVQAFIELRKLSAQEVLLFPLVIVKSIFILLFARINSLKTYYSVPDLIHISLRPKHPWYKECQIKNPLIPCWTEGAQHEIAEPVESIETRSVELKEMSWYINTWPYTDSNTFVEKVREVNSEKVPFTFYKKTEVKTYYKYNIKKMMTAAFYRIHEYGYEYDDVVEAFEKYGKKLTLLK